MPFLFLVRCCDLIQQILRVKHQSLSLPVRWLGIRILILWYVEFNPLFLIMKEYALQALGFTVNSTIWNVVVRRCVFHHIIYTRFRLITVENVSLLLILLIFKVIFILIQIIFCYFRIFKICVIVHLNFIKIIRFLLLIKLRF